MTALPTGTITFLLTDIEGSTALWEDDPAAARRALARHEAVIAAAVADHSGHLVKSRGEGDSTFSVFEHATAAVAAAAALQRALHIELWPTREALRVRMALHTGEAELRPSRSPASGPPSTLSATRTRFPHVFAANKLDALFGLGYVHAQDRLWQMEFQRRIGFGRLSEIFGSSDRSAGIHRFLGTVGFGRAANAAWQRMPEWAREQVNAYTAGVNAFISSHHGSRAASGILVAAFRA